MRDILGAHRVGHGGQDVGVEVRQMSSQAWQQHHSSQGCHNKQQLNEWPVPAALSCSGGLHLHRRIRIVREVP